MSNRGPAPSPRRGIPRSDGGDAIDSMLGQSPATSSAGCAEERTAPKSDGERCWVFPPRGPGRPSIQQVFSEPSLRKDVLGLGDADPERPGPRQGLGDIFEVLDKHAAARQQECERQQLASQAAREQQLQVERNRAFLRLAAERAAWTPCDPPGFFERPEYVTGEAATCVKNPFLMGMYAAPGWKPPHHEYNVRNGWNPHSRNDRNEVLAEFGAKPKERMSQRERKFAERLERTLGRAKALEKRDALLRTQGDLRKRYLEEHAEEHSCLKREKEVWALQHVSTHVVFSSPEPYKPGEQPYETGLRRYIEQPDRANSYERDFIAGDPERTCFWHPPKARAIAGSAQRLQKAQELLCPRGCKSLLAGTQSKSTGALR